MAVDFEVQVDYQERNRGHGMDSDRVDRINVTNGLV